MIMNASKASVQIKLTSQPAVVTQRQTIRGGAQCHLLLHAIGSSSPGKPLA